MIHIVAKVFNLFTLTLQNVIVVASLIGQVIVALSSAVITSVLSVFRSLLYFLEVVYEDNQFIFTEQLPNFANNVMSGCVDQWVWVGDTVGALCDTVYSRTSDAAGAVCWLVYASTTVVVEVLYLIRNFVIFFGDSLWLIITFIPCQLPLLIRAFGRYVKEIMFNTIVDVYMSLLKLTNFLSDVPIESFVGIMSAVIIVRLCIHFREDIQSYGNDLYWLLIRRLLYWYHTLYNYFTDSEVRQIANMASGPEVEGPESSGRILEDDPADPAEALCVICQERQKCVLILPCRHVCLCRECCLRLYGYQRTCPICRTFIYHSVNIYL